MQTRSRLTKRAGADYRVAKLIFADHPLLPVDFVFDPIPGSIALSEEQANDFVAALGGMLDAPIREKFDCLADAVFVL